MGLTLLAILVVASCSTEGIKSAPKTCTQGAVTVGVGQSIAAGDNCNQCVCGADGKFICTGRDCQPDAGGPPTCTSDGQTYSVGQSFKLDCNTCSCTANGLACTMMACPISTGGVASTGGVPATGGVRATGGVVATGGVLATGGVRSTGGMVATGGVVSTGGTTIKPDAGPPTCTSNGKSYAVGESFKIDCNTCTCSAQGIACTAMACIRDAGIDLSPITDTKASCTLSANLTFGWDGGNALYVDQYRLTNSGITLTRNYAYRADRDADTTATCSPSLPTCGDASTVSVATINADLANADVADLWSLPLSPIPLFGTDSRPVDGAVYSIALENGHKVLVGGQCASPTMSSCRYIPAGLQHLVQDLQSLAKVALADPVCKGL